MKRRIQMAMSAKFLSGALSAYGMTSMVRGDVLAAALTLVISFGFFFWAESQVDALS